MAERVLVREAAPVACPPPVVCDRFDTGHLLHPVHERMLGNRPWGWRSGVVVWARSRDGGVEVVVEYVTDEGVCRLWHHVDLLLDQGLPVRVHEQYHALDVGTGPLNVRLLGGVGPVLEPLSR
jgi:hypothetical protein